MLLKMLNHTICDLDTYLKLWIKTLKLLFKFPAGIFINIYQNNYHIFAGIFDSFFFLSAPRRIAVYCAEISLLNN